MAGVHSYLRPSAIDGLRPPAVVAKSGSVNSLAAIRSLGRASIRTIAVDSDSRALGFYSRYSEAIVCPDPKLDTDGFVEFLTDLGSKLGDRVPIFPTNDPYLNVISAHQASLGDYFLFPFPDADLLEKIQDKRFQVERAAALGIPYPLTSELPRDDFRFPVIVKPIDSEQFKRTFWRQAFRCDDTAALDQAYERALPFTPIVQEFIPGADDTLYTLGAYIDRSGEPLAVFCGRKLRQTSKGIGICRIGEAKWVDEVVESGLRYLSGLKYHGIAQVEFKYDARDGTYKLIEINPRLWEWHGLASACGVDIPTIAYRALRAEPVRPARAGSQRLRWVVTVAPGRFPVTTLPPVVDAVFSVDDPKPFLRQLARSAFSGRARRVVRRILKRVLSALAASERDTSPR